MSLPEFMNSLWDYTRRTIDPYGVGIGLALLIGMAIDKWVW